MSIGRYTTNVSADGIDVHGIAATVLAPDQEQVLLPRTGKGGDASGLVVTGFLWSQFEGNHPQGWQGQIQGVGFAMEGPVIRPLTP